MEAKFGPSGNSESFYAAGFKSSIEAPAWIRSLGLDAYEYQCSRGVSITTPTAEALGEAARENGIALSIHAPYYINLSSDGESREKAVDYIMQSCRAARDMGATRIVVHSGSCAKQPRERAMELSGETLKYSLEAVKNAGYGDIYICPETMGKINQLGTVEEIIRLCNIDPQLLPCIDFGHVYAHSLGEYHDYESFKRVFEVLFSGLDEKRAKGFHAHFSRIEFTEKGGEKKHWRYCDTQFGPDFDPIAKLLDEYDAHPTIICESMGTQADDAVILKKIYQNARGV